MFVEELRRAADRAPRERLSEVGQAVWKAFAAGGITEEEADELSRLVAARQAVPVAPAEPRRWTGPRPRSPASLERRRRWSAAGYLPPILAARFTPAETAALAVMASRFGPDGTRPCDLAVGHIAALAGVSESTVRNALREAKALGLLRVQERRVTAFRNDTNLVTLYSPEWRAWLRKRPRASAGGGCKSVQGTSTPYENKAAATPSRSVRRAAEGQQAGPKARNRLPARFAEPGRAGDRAHAPGAWRRSP